MKKYNNNKNKYRMGGPLRYMGGGSHRNKYVTGGMYGPNTIPGAMIPNAASTVYEETTTPQQQYINRRLGDLEGKEWQSDFMKEQAANQALGSAALQTGTSALRAGLPHLINMSPKDLQFSQNVTRGFLKNPRQGWGADYGTLARAGAPTTTMGRTLENPGFGTGVGTAMDVAGQIGQQAWSDDDPTTFTGKEKFARIGSGVGKGMRTGAQLGSIIPGVGTAVGAGVGATIGGISSAIKGKKEQEEAQEELALRNIEKAGLLNRGANLASREKEYTGYDFGVARMGGRRKYPHGGPHSPTPIPTEAPPQQWGENISPLAPNLQGANPYITPGTNAYNNALLERNYTTPATEGLMDAMEAPGLRQGREEMKGVEGGGNWFDKWKDIGRGERNRIMYDEGGHPHPHTLEQEHYSNPAHRSPEFQKYLVDNPAWDRWRENAVSWGPIDPNDPDSPHESLNMVDQQAMDNAMRDFYVYSLYNDESRDWSKEREEYEKHLYGFNRGLNRRKEGGKRRLYRTGGNFKMGGGPLKYANGGDKEEKTGKGLSPFVLFGAPPDRLLRQYNQYKNLTMDDIRKGSNIPQMGLDLRGIYSYPAAAASGTIDMIRAADAFNQGKYGRALGYGTLGGISFIPSVGSGAKATARGIFSGLQSLKSWLAPLYRGTKLAKWMGKTAKYGEGMGYERSDDFIGGEEGEKVDPTLKMYMQPKYEMGGRRHKHGGPHDDNAASRDTINSFLWNQLPGGADFLALKTIGEFKDPLKQMKLSNKRIGDIIDPAAFERSRKRLGIGSTKEDFYNFYGIDIDNVSKLIRGTVDNKIRESLKKYE